MTIRTHLAAMAMAGLLGQHSSFECESGARDIEPAHRFDEVPALALRQANMLIAELNKQQPSS